MTPGARRVLTLASAAVALAAADTYVVVLALPDMMAGAGLSIDDLTRATPIISGFLLGYIAVLPLIGRLCDVVSRRRVLTGCLLLFVAGSVITALSADLGVMVAGRVLQGTGGGGLVPATLALVASHWPPARRGTPLGVVGAVQEIGSVLGPLLGAAILAAGTWRDIFWVNAAAGAILAAALATGPAARPRLTARNGLFAASTAALVLSLAAPRGLTRHVLLGLPFVPLGGGGSRLDTPLGWAALAGLSACGVWSAYARRDVLARVDLPGAACAAIALGSLVLTFASADPQREAIGPWGIVLLPAGVAALAAGAWWHRHAPSPLIPRGLVTPVVACGLLTSLAVGAALVAIVVDVPVLARLTPAHDQADAALVLVRFLLALPAGAFTGGVLLRRLAPGPVAAAGLVVAAAALGVMATWHRGSLEETVPATLTLIAAGAGLGLAIAPVNAAVLDAVSAGSHGVAGSLVVVARMTGMVAGLALLTAYGVRSYYAHVAALPADAALHHPEILLDAAVVQVRAVFAGAAGCALAGALLACGLGLRRDHAGQDSSR